MNKKGRLVFLVLSLISLLVIGRVLTGSFGFILEDFWFTSGLFLLILLSVIDQPHFSKDSNIFLNAATAWMSLMLITPQERTAVWWAFFVATTYLITSSYILIWIRTKELKEEHWVVALISRLNRELGRPEALFSTFFLWGAVRQFGISSSQFNALLLYWTVFMILNMPAFAKAISSLFSLKKVTLPADEGEILNLIDPKVAEVLLPTNFPEKLIGKTVKVLTSKKEEIGQAVFIDERTISGSRIGKVAITAVTEKWRMISDTSNGQCRVRFHENGENNNPISVVDKGTSIDHLVFYLHPDIVLEEGEILHVDNSDGKRIFYQVVSAIITEEISQEKNAIQSIKVVASQLGQWLDDSKTFVPYSWVPPSGQLIFQGKNINIDLSTLPAGHSAIGNVPNSNFPVHVCLEDIVTHNTAIIGVTGSGKSYLSFDLVEALIKANIKVMILDLTREHYQYLHRHSPFPLKAPADVATWLGDDKSSPLAIHQFAAAISFPLATSQFVSAAFDILSKEKLTAGKNLPAKLCIVFEEAHSLVPEWNQVSVQSDKDHVNNTAKVILQGRKFGLGSILVTQRTANVTKTILNQCNTIFALQSFDQTGLEFLKNYMGEEYSSALSRIPKRQAVLVGKASSSQKPVILKINDFDNRWEGPPEESGCEEPKKGTEPA